MTKQEILENYGKQDGFDDFRYEQAQKLSPIVDRSVYQCFISLIRLEEKNLITITEE